MELDLQRYTHRFEKKEKHYTARLATEHDINAIVALEEIVYSNMPEHEKEYFMPHDIKWFSNHFNKQNHVAVIEHNGEIIAKGNLIITDENLEHQGIAHSSALWHRLSLKQAGFLSGGCVHPDHTRAELQHTVSKIRLAVADELGVNTAITVLNIKNIKSLRSNIKTGLNLESCEIDPRDNIMTYYLAGNIPEIRHKFNMNATAAMQRPDKPTIYIPNDQTDKIISQLETHRGVIWNPDENTIGFHPR